MKRTLLTIAVSALCLFGAQAKHYAVLVAGSNTFDNYRHQADIFHAYQVLKRNGIDPENIITFAYDDIANSSENPFKGKVFNKPAKKDAVDVYEGVKIDYKGKEVTPENFLAVIQGEKDKVKGPVLTSTADDNVFIYFADHGATGLIAFPVTYLYADKLIKALNTMHEKKMYNELVFYIEACESGSMFHKLLPANISIYATTASNSEESSYATYCYPDDNINGKHINSCLGDLYSVNFLENLDKVDPSKETLIQQFKIVKNETNLSPVQKFGNMTIDKEIIGNFEANNGTHANSFTSFDAHHDLMTKLRSSVSSRNVKLHNLQRKHELLQTEESSKALLDELNSVRKLDTTFNTIKGLFNLDVKASVDEINFDCLRTRVAMYEEICGKFSDYGLKYVRHIHQTCEQGVDVERFEAALIDSCYNYSF